jgi:hypothetical protein
MLAYFIATHKSPAQVLHLLEAIYREEDIYTIHVDRKSEAQVEEAIREGTAGKANIHFLERQFTNWSGWSWVRVEVDAISSLIERDARWTHYINLSGQDYPLVPVSVVAEFLQCHPRQSFLEVEAPKRSVRGDEYFLFLGRWNRYHLDLKSRGKLGPYRVPGIPHRFPKGLTWYRGGAWKILSREFCEFVASGTDPLLKVSKDFWRWTCCPEENFFQTLIMNSRFRCSVIADDKREIVWPGPKTFTIADYPYLKTSSKFIARKFDMDVDRSILVRLASDLHAAPARHSSAQKSKSTTVGF